MIISTEQIEKVLTQSKEPRKNEVDAAVIRLTDKDLIDQVVESVEAMPDREDLVASLKARIEAGNYNPTGAEIADVMIRRSIADRIR